MQNNWHHAILLSLGLHIWLKDNYRKILMNFFLKSYDLKAHQVIFPFTIYQNFDTVPSTPMFKIC